MIGDDKSHTNVRNLSPLAIAILRGNLEIVDFFLNLPSCGINVRDDSGRTCLHYACETDFTGIIKHLVVIGADVNA